jgi:hypothetical protein
MENGWDTDTAYTTTVTTATDSNGEQQQQQQLQQQCAPCAIANDSCNYTQKAATAVTSKPTAVSISGSSHNSSSHHNGAAAKVNKADLSHKYPLRQGGSSNIPYNTHISSSSSSSNTSVNGSSNVTGNSHVSVDSFNTAAGADTSSDSISAAVAEGNHSDAVTHSDDNSAATTTRYVS